MGADWLHSTRWARWVMQGCLVAIVAIVGFQVFENFSSSGLAQSAASGCGFLFGAIGILALNRGWRSVAFGAGLSLSLVGFLGLCLLLLTYGGFGSKAASFGHDLLHVIQLPLNVAGPFAFLGLGMMALAKKPQPDLAHAYVLATCVVAALVILAVGVAESLVPDLHSGVLHHRPASLEEIVLLLLLCGASGLHVLLVLRDRAMLRGSFWPLLAFLLVLASSFNLWLFLAEKENSILLELTRDHGERLERVLKEYQSDRMAALERMANRYEISGGDMSHDHWLADTQRYLESYAELIAIGVLTPERRIRWAATRTNPDFGIGRKYGDDSVRDRLLRETRDNDSTMLSPPLDLFPDQAGQVAALPLYQEERFLGWLVASIGLDVLFENIVENIARQYFVRVSINGDEVFSRWDDELEDPDPMVQRRFEAMGVNWTIEVSPTPAMIGKRVQWLPSLMLLVGIIAAGLFGVALFQLSRVRATTQELAYSEHRFRLVAEQTGELIYDCNLLTGEVDWAGAIEEMAGTQFQAFRSMTLVEWIERIHPEDRETQVTPAISPGNVSQRYHRQYRFKVDDHHIDVEDEGVVLASETGRPERMLGAIKDVSRRLDQEQQLRFLAHHDALTGLINRGRFIETAEETLHLAPDRPPLAALVLLDIDRFRSINETLGYETGDQLLRAVGDRLASTLGSTVKVARVGSDRFGLLLTIDGSEARLREQCRELLDIFSRPFTISKHSLFVTVTAGVAFFPDHSDTAETLFQAAEIAVAHAKERGRNQLLFFEAAMRRDATGNLWIANRLREAMENREFELHFQPRVNLATGKVTGMEALLRWFRPDGESISPGRFIPVAEESGMIGPIGWYVVDAAIDAAKQLGPDLMRDRRIAINVSARQLMDRKFAYELMSRLAERNASPDWFEIELTESMLMDDQALSRQLTEDLHRAGFKVAIDDFGTGYSSLNYLKHLAVDYLKIDQSFVRGLPDNDNDVAIVTTIIAMAHGLQLTLIAEGIEEEVQREFLLEAGCEEGQGFLMARPMPLDDLAKMLKDS